MVAIIEQVRDGSSLRLLLLLEQDGINVHQYVTVLISGIKCPVYRKDIPNVEDLVEPFAEEAKFFVETRLLNKKIHVLLESVTGQGTNINFYGSIQHPVGNIAEFLLKEGYAKVLDWNLAVVTNSEKYKPCEQLAKSKKLRVWKSFVKQTNDIGNSSNQFQAEVTKILGPDFIQVEHQGKARKIYFSSIRGPKRMKNDLDCEIGYYVNAIEYLRTRLIGQKVSIKIDYIKPAEGEYEQRECATIKKGESNIAEGLVSKGYAYVIKHRKDDHSRSSAYDSLLHAEEKAIEAAKGVHSTKELPIHRIIDASENLAKAKSYFAQLQRADKLKGVVEYVASGSRFRILVPTLSLRLTFILSGIKTPRSARGDQKGEPYGTEALAFSSKRILQREVEFMVEGQDKAGSFIGTLLTGSDNLAILLLQEGLSTVHEFSASGSPYASQWKAAQEEAKELKKNIWKNYVMDTVTKEVEEFKISQDTPKIVEVIVCEIASDGVLNLQIVGPDLSKLEKLMSDFANHHSGVGQQVMTPFTPKVGDYCSAQFSVDKQWYRARVRKINGVNSYTVHYIDYGNSEPLPGSRLRALPQQFSVSVLKAQSHLAQLAYVDLAPIDGEFGEDAMSLLGSLCVGDLAAHIVGVSSTSNGSSLSVVLYRKNNLVSINEELIRESLAIVTPAEVKRFDVEQRNNKKKFLGQRVTANSVKSELEKLIDAQTLAKRNRVSFF
ncbi:nuclease domain-containing protein [Globomyces sp. JEL0801]|nr:nuclease domain-containing protein [Globomyces sp. JEL0801]